MLAVATIFAAYIIGAIPTGFLVGKIGYGLDIRQLGSGNIGATNVRRVLGLKAGLLVLGLDILKGVLVVLGAVWISTETLGFTAKATADNAVLIVLAASAVIIGNMFSIFIGGRGGKGVGVASGVILAMVPEMVGILLVVWLVVVAVSKYVSVASLTIAVLFPLLMWWFHQTNTAYVIFAIIVAALVFFSHRANIKRLFAGGELKIGQEAGKR